MNPIRPPSCPPLFLLNLPLPWLIGLSTALLNYSNCLFEQILI